MKDEQAVGGMGHWSRVKGLITCSYYILASLIPAVLYCWIRILLCLMLVHGCFEVSRCVWAEIFPTIINTVVNSMESPWSLLIC
jgi:hypothetical protein